MFQGEKLPAFSSLVMAMYSLIDCREAAFSKLLLNCHIVVSHIQGLSQEASRSGLPWCLVHFQPELNCEQDLRGQTRVPDNRTKQLSYMRDSVIKIVILCTTEASLS